MTKTGIILAINYPEPKFRIKKEGTKEQIFDPVRKKWLVLTSEEWVRQNFVQFLVQERNYPSSLIALEKELSLGELRKRFDILVYDSGHRAWMMIECKGPEIKLDNTVVEQLLRYHISIPVPYLVITNGEQTYAWKKTGQGFSAMVEFPVFGE